MGRANRGKHSGGNMRPADSSGSPWQEETRTVPLPDSSPDVDRDNEIELGPGYVRPPRDQDKRQFRGSGIGESIPLPKKPQESSGLDATEPLPGTPESKDPNRGDYVTYPNQKASEGPVRQPQPPDLRDNNLDARGIQDDDPVGKYDFVANPKPKQRPRAASAGAPPSDSWNSREARQNANADSSPRKKNEADSLETNDLLYRPPSAMEKIEAEREQARAREVWDDPNASSRERREAARILGLPVRIDPDAEERAFYPDPTEHHLYADNSSGENVARSEGFSANQDMFYREPSAEEKAAAKRDYREAQRVWADPGASSLERRQAARTLGLHVHIEPDAEERAMFPDDNKFKNIPYGNDKS